MEEPGVTFIHRLALVDESSSVGRGTKVWQFASVIRNSVIGSNCNIATCSIVDGSELGDNVIVSHGAFIDPGMVIRDSVFIGPGVKLCNDAWPRVDKAGFDMGPLIKRDVVITYVDVGASLGAAVVVLPGLTIGADALIAAGAVVTKNVPPAHLYKRDGSMVPISLDKPVRRIRPCST